MQFWTKRLSRLESVRNQLNSVVVLNILHNLEQAHSTYAQAFIHVHRYAVLIPAVTLKTLEGGRGARLQAPTKCT